MAHSNNSVITGKFKGSLGKEIVFRNWDGKTVVAKAPEHKQGVPMLNRMLIQLIFAVFFCEGKGHLLQTSLNKRHHRQSRLYVHFSRPG